MIPSQLSVSSSLFSQFDGFLSLTSLSKGSTIYSQCLPQNTDANRGLTEDVPPLLTLLNSLLSKQDLQVLRPEQTLWCHFYISKLGIKDTFQHKIGFKNIISKGPLIIFNFISDKFQQKHSLVWISKGKDLAIIHLEV